MNGKKLISGILSVALAASILVPGILPTKVSAAESNLIAHFTFDDAQGFKSGDYTANIIEGNIDTSSKGKIGNGAKFDGKSYLKITDSNGKSPLSGCNECTISYYSWTENSGSNNGWTIFAERGGINHTTYLDEHYLGVMDRKTSLTVERFNGNGWRTESIVKEDAFKDWKQVTIVYSDYLTYLYIDGQYVSYNYNVYPIRDILGDNSVFQVGKANWGKEYYKGMYDDLKIYNKALTATEISQIYDEDIRKASATTPAPTSIVVPTTWPSDGTASKPTTTPTTTPTANTTSKPTATPTAKPTSAASSSSSGSSLSNNNSTSVSNSTEKPSTTKTTTAKTYVDMSGVTLTIGTEFLEVGKSTNITVSIPESLKSSSTEVTYSSAGAVSVSKDGVVTANKVGLAKVFVKIATPKKSITKVIRLKTFQITGDNKVKKGKKITFKAEGANSVEWSVNNKKLATISKTGVLTAKKKGTVTVIAIVDGVRVTKKVKIKK